MTTSPTPKSSRVYWVAILGTFLIMAGFVGLLRRYTRPAPANQKRIEERRKAAAEANLAAQQLQSYAVLDAAKGLHQLRIDQAMEMVIRGSQNPVALRTNLLGRVDKFNAAAPVVPSQFE